MTNPTGQLTVKAGGREYRLHLGFSVLAELQASMGDRFDALFAAVDSNKIPDLSVIVEIFRASLKRHHADALEADPYLVDDIMAENGDAWLTLLAASFPDMQPGGEAPAGGKTKAAPSTSRNSAKPTSPPVSRPSGSGK